MKVRFLSSLIVALALTVAPISIGASYAEVGTLKVTKAKQKSQGGVKIFSSCSAYGNPSCSIDCPVGKAAICTPGGAFPAKCVCQ